MKPTITPMSILIVTDAWHPQVNGVVRTYEFIYDVLTQQGHKVTIISPFDFSRHIPCFGYPEIDLVLAPYKRLSTLIDAAAPDHIHIATEGPLGKAAAKYCRRRAFRFSTAYHTHFPDYIAQRVAKILPFLYAPTRKAAIAGLRRFHNRSSAVMVATQSLEDELRSWGFTAPLLRLTRGVNTDIFYPGEKTGFQELKRPIALYAGRVAIEKNLEDFLNIPWHGSKVVIGTGPDKSILKQKYPDVIFTGNMTGKDLGTAMRSADIFVFPSRTDTFGMVLIEALACGLPVAAYNVTGPKDIITNDILGYLHDSDLSAAINAILDTPDMMNSAAATQRHAHITENYTWERAAEQFINIASRINKQSHIP